MAKLPENMEQENIKNMSEGDTGYTVPWAMWADDKWDLYINGNFPIFEKAFGTAHMKIKRTKTGVIVYRSSIVSEKYTPSNRSTGFEQEVLPVEELK